MHRVYAVYASQMSMSCAWFICSRQAQRQCWQIDAYDFLIVIHMCVCFCSARYIHPGFHGFSTWWSLGHKGNSHAPQRIHVHYPLCKPHIRYAHAKISHTLFRHDVQVSLVAEHNYVLLCQCLERANINNVHTPTPVLPALVQNNGIPWLWVSRFNSFYSELYSTISIIGKEKALTSRTFLVACRTQSCFVMSSFASFEGSFMTRCTSSIVPW